MATTMDKDRKGYSASRTLTKLLDSRYISPNRIVQAVNLLHRVINIVDLRTEKYNMTRCRAKKRRMLLNAVWKVQQCDSMMLTMLHTGGAQAAIPLGVVAFSPQGFEEGNS